MAETCHHNDLERRRRHILKVMRDVFFEPIQADHVAAEGYERQTERDNELGNKKSKQFL